MLTFRRSIGRSDVQTSTQDLLHLWVTAQKIVAYGELTERESISRVQNHGAFQRAQSFFVVALATKDISSQFENSRIVRQPTARGIQFRPGGLVIAQRII